MTLPKLFAAIVVDPSLTILEVSPMVIPMVIPSEHFAVCFKLCFNGAKTWDNIPLDIRNSPSVGDLKKNDQTIASGVL